jgi:S-adenosylmethionine synthetase
MQISEYVSIGHPDKIADYISEYILDRILEQDAKSRYALEVQIKDNFVSLGGEVTTNAKTEYEKWVSEAIKEIGYTHEYSQKWGKENSLDCTNIEVIKHISEQSNDIACGVNNEGWGDQGIMFGLAVNDESTDYMPKDYYLAKTLCETLFESKIGGLDIKTQVVVDKNFIPPCETNVKKVIVAIPLLEDRTKDVVKVVKSVVGNGDYKILINGTGKYVKHASMGDCGTTGRKLAVDFYGGNCNIGGGSPWTKDGTKADLTLNLYARKIALDYVKKEKLDYVKCGIGCCIGRKEIDITLFDENNQEIVSWTESKTPKELIKLFQLDKPIYAQLCRNGLFSSIERD